MATLEVYLSQNGGEKYKEAVKLNDIGAANDPENEPYKSKYKAREIFHEIKVEIDGLLSENPSDIKLIILSGALDLRLGKNYSETDEFSTGEEHLQRCIDSLKEHRLDKRVCNVLQSALNELGVLWTGRRQPKKAEEYLNKAKKLYEDFSRDVGNTPWNADDVFAHFCKSNECSESNGEDFGNNFEDTHTLTLYYLAQVCNQLEDCENAAAYCQTTLLRQLEYRKYDPRDWSLNAATLSQYYLTQNNYFMARHCLASANRILEECGEQPECLRVEPEVQESGEELECREKLPQSWAGLFRCWIKYGLALLEYSKDKLCESSGRDETESGNERGETSADYSDREKLFKLELTSFEEQISCERAIGFEDARQIFLAVQKWINAAKEFYNLDGHCTDYVELIQDHSHLFKLLAFYELDEERQCRMHKRRVDMLEATLKELNPQYYMLICRQLQYEIAETYSAMMDAKLIMIEQINSAPSQHAINKINTLCEKSMQYYRMYLDTLKEPQTNELPATFAEEDERPALLAHFCMGRLYSKIIQFDDQSKLTNLKKSLDNYGFLVDYCKRNPSAVDKVQTERELCEEMLQLLPHKMERIRSHMS